MHLIIPANFAFPYFPSPWPLATLFCRLYFLGPAEPRLRPLLDLWSFFRVRELVRLGTTRCSLRSNGRQKRRTASITIGCLTVLGEAREAGLDTLPIPANDMPAFLHTFSDLYHLVPIYLHFNKIDISKYWDLLSSAGWLG